MSNWKEELKDKLENYKEDLTKVSGEETKKLLKQEIRELELFITAAEQEIEQVKLPKQD
ncbi:hypothetical protein [Priestia aryabhattai]